MQNRVNGITKAAQVPPNWQEIPHSTVDSISIHSASVGSQHFLFCLFAFSMSRNGNVVSMFCHSRFGRHTQRVGTWNTHNQSVKRINEFFFIKKNKNRKRREKRWMITITSFALRGICSSKHPHTHETMMAIWTFEKRHYMRCFLRRRKKKWKTNSHMDAKHGTCNERLREGTSITRPQNWLNQTDNCVHEARNGTKIEQMLRLPRI